MTSVNEQLGLTACFYVYDDRNKSGVLEVC